MQTRHTTIESPLGELVLAAAGETLTGVYFPQHWHAPGAGTLGDYVDCAADNLFSEAADQLGQYLAGQREHFDLPVALNGQTRQRRIWELLSHIAYGQTKTYGELAVELADGTTAYEVGQAVGRNPLSIVVPCHRVVARNGSLTGYAGGLKRKRFLLDLEEPSPALAGRLF